MTYSCALWADDVNDQLEAAQYRKLDFFLSRVKPGGSIVDVGCGWGSLLQRAVETGVAKTSTGLTLSSAQADYVNALALDGVVVRESDWRDFSQPNKCDGIISIGAFEHFASPTMTRSEQLDSYTNFFAWAWENLATGGSLCLQTIAAVADETSPQFDGSHREFFTSTIFPESTLPRVPDLFCSSDRFFRVETVRFDGDHYARTCREWRSRLASNRQAASDLVGPETVDTYMRYLAASQMIFRLRSVTLVRLVLRPHSKPLATTL